MNFLEMGFIRFFLKIGVMDGIRLHFPTNLQGFNKNRMPSYLLEGK